MRTFNLIIEPRLKRLVLNNQDEFKDIFEDEDSPPYIVNGNTFIRAMNKFFDDYKLYQYLYSLSSDSSEATSILNNLLYKNITLPEQVNFKKASMFAINSLGFEKTHGIIKNHLQSDHAHNINIVSSSIRNEVKQLLDKNDLYEHFLQEIDSIQEDMDRLIIASDLSYDFIFHSKIVKHTSDLVKEISNSELAQSEKSSLLVLIEDIPKSELR